MSIRFFNTLTRQVEEFQPLEPGRVRMYTCGPTVYNYAHIGNFRAYAFEDLLQRHLEFRGFQVERVMNLTDVDDKTIRGCRAQGVPLAEFTKPFKEGFFQDLATLRIKPANHFPEATADRHIARMIEMIGTLVERGHAYRAEDGSVYFRIRTFPNYGQLAHFNLEELQPSGRVRSDEYEKEQIGDFALWKAWDEADGDVAWESPWGRGRPGWHIECSALALRELGTTIDLHGGGTDLIFPHHECERAQSEAATGEPFVKHWMHTALISKDGAKMSKSLGNLVFVDKLRTEWDPMVIRLGLVEHHYRTEWEWDDDLMPRNADRLARWRAAADGAPSSVLDEVRERLDDDLDTPGAVAAIEAAATAGDATRAAAELLGVVLDAPAGEGPLP
jgi:cysteinyl-tRNA synthetase